MNWLQITYTNIKNIKVFKFHSHKINRNPINPSPQNISETENISPQNIIENICEFIQHCKNISTN